MDRSNVIELISQTYTEDDIGQMIPRETSRQVFCDIASISRNEYFEAAQAGLTAEYKVTMFAPDYEGEKVVVLNGKRFGVYRTYLGDNETVELYLQKKAGA